MTRGERLNNPMNIRITPAPWRGKIEPSSDPDFEQFDTAANGIRAGAKLLANYYRVYGLSTIDQIISRWSPPCENDTLSYVDDVAERMGVDPAESLNILDPGILASLVTAVIRHENGECIYSADQIAASVDEGTKD